MAPCDPVTQMPAMYESWDLSLPVVPPRSRLYSLEPIGIGTAWVESLTGYLARLAEAHAVSVGDLVGPKLLRNIVEGPPLPPKEGGGTYRNAFQVRSYRLNGLTESARSCIEAVEAATLCRGLSVLTLLPFASMVDRSNLLRRIRAWCPRCYEEKRQARNPVYDSLLWAVKAVTLCSRHHQPLEERCPHCDRWQHPLASYTRPGYCSRCHCWLGLQGGTDAGDGERRQDYAHYDLWVATAVGDLLAAAPRLHPPSLQGTVRHNLRSYVDRLADGNQTGFARIVKSSQGPIHKWLTAQRIPRLDGLLRLCYRLQISLVTLVTRGGAETWVDGSVSESALVELNRVARRHRHRDRVRRILEEALHEEPAPSLHDIAHRLGYTSTVSLYAVDREICKRITANHRRATHSHGRKKRATVQICDEATTKRFLESVLAQHQPISVNQLSRSLGHVHSSTLWRKFPDLCRAISAKTAAQKRTLRHAAEQALRAALQEDPPPSLSKLSNRVGYMSTMALRRHFPVLCAALQAQRKQYRVKRIAELRNVAQAQLSKEPPPSLQTVCRRLGVAVTHLRHHCPDLAHAIVARYLGHRADVTRKRREAMREEVRRAICTLLDQGIYPSYARVSGLLNINTRNCWKIIAQCRQEAIDRRDEGSVT